MKTKKYRPFLDQLNLLQVKLHFDEGEVIIYPLDERSTPTRHSMPHAEVEEKNFFWGKVVVVDTLFKYLVLILLNFFRVYKSLSASWIAAAPHLYIVVVYSWFDSHGNRASAAASIARVHPSIATLLPLVRLWRQMRGRLCKPKEQLWSLKKESNPEIYICRSKIY